MNLLNVFEMILLSSLIGSLIVLVILITKGIFRNKLSPCFHYYIWLILLLKLIIPVGPQTPLNVSNMYENFYMQSPTNEKAQINPSKQVETTDLDNSTSITPIEYTTKGIINIPLEHKLIIEKVLCFIWLLGVVILSLRLIKGHKKLKKIVTNSIKNVTTLHNEILYSCKKVMNIRTEVGLSYSRVISSPSLCGLISPHILIPTNVAENVCDEEFEYIIMHELTHFKNRDILINWFITLLSMLYWFNPILLYGFHKMRQDCESSCDNRAISYLDEGKNIQYGNSIIRVLELTGSSTKLMGTTSMVMNSSQIKRRIIMISKFKKVNIKNILLASIIVVVVGGAAIALNTSKSKVDQPIVIAEEFVRNLYTVDANKVAEFNKLGQIGPGVIGEGATKESTAATNDEYTKAALSLDKSVQPLMTAQGYDSIVTTTFNILGAKICAENNYTSQVTSFTLGENVYKDNGDKVRYLYEANLKFTSTDGKDDVTDSTKGYVELLKENGQWKVDQYNITSPLKLYR